MKIDWYFDFISPFAYIQHVMLANNHPEVEVNPIPVVFGGLLQHHTHKGPAEIPLKRIMTYRYCQWYADKHDIPLRFPDVHPFRPILPLRLCISQGSTPQIISAIFNTIWVEGKDLNDANNLQNFCEQHGIGEVEQAVSRQDVKDQLKQNTDQAIALGAFGVPTISVKGELFWGVDMLELAVAYLEHPDMFESEKYSRLTSLQSALW